MLSGSRRLGVEDPQIWDKALASPDFVRGLDAMEVNRLSRHCHFN